MTILVRGNREGLRRSAAFTVSCAVHGFLLAWLLASAAWQMDVPRSIYDREIRPSEHRLIWYNLRTRVPDVAPAHAAKKPQALRAQRKLEQNLIAGTKDDERPKPMVWIPDPPKIEPPKPKLEPLPNVLAVAAPKPAPPKPPRQFVAPEVHPRIPETGAPLPEAPKIEAPQPVAVGMVPGMLAAATAKPVRRFLSPEQHPHLPAAPPAELARLPEAPKITQRVEEVRLPFDLPSGLTPTRRFVQPTLPAPANATPPAPMELPRPPEIHAVPSTDTAAASLAIIGLDPAKVAPPVKPPPPREAGFSGGLQPKPGENNPASNASLVVPGLLAESGAKDAARDHMPLLITDLSPTSHQNLVAALRESPPGVPRAPSQPQATRVSGAPDPRLNGRLIYMVAIHMPNITSFSGNWIVWFAERDPRSGGLPPAMRSPVPLHKVDPRYAPTAAREGVEGIIRLSAVIRKDGRVDSVELLKSLDERLDNSAQEALAKWVFEPAQRDGRAVDVDAVFEIPFHLAPKSAK